MGTFVQANRGYEANNDTSFAVAYNSNVTAGNLLVVTIGFYHATSTISTVADTRGTTWTQAGTLLRAVNFAPNTALAVYYGLAPSSGANTVTVTWSAANADKEIKVFEVSGVDATTPLHQTNGAVGQGGSPASGNITTTLPGFVIKVEQDYAWVTHSEAAGTPSTGWTEFGDTATGSDSAYQNFTGTGTYNGGFAVAPFDPQDWCCRIVAFADAVAGGGTILRHMMQYH